MRACGETEAWANCAEEELRALDPEAPVFHERRRELRQAPARDPPPKGGEGLEAGQDDRVEAVVCLGDVHERNAR